MIVWSAFGLPSLTTLILLADWISRHRLLGEDRKPLLGAAAIVAIVFYPMAIGLVHVDAYRFGFTPWAPIALALLGIAAAPRFFRLACALLLIAIAFAVHLLPSLNLFDYVIDPFLGLFAIGWCVVWLVTAMLRSRHARSSR